MSDHYRKSVGYRGEEVVKKYYEQQGFFCIVKNFTIRGGEIDLVMENGDVRVFVEVKVVNYIESLHDYVSPRKLQTFQRTIQTYLWKHQTDKKIRLDVVFVKDESIIELIENIEI